MGLLLIIVMAKHTIAPGFNLHLNKHTSTNRVSQKESKD